MINYKEKRKHKATPVHTLLHAHVTSHVPPVCCHCEGLDSAEEESMTLQGATPRQDYGPRPWSYPFLCKLQGFCILHRRTTRSRLVLQQKYLSQAGPMGTTAEVSWSIFMTKYCCYVKFKWIHMRDKLEVCFRE